MDGYPTGRTLVKDGLQVFQLGEKKEFCFCFLLFWEAIVLESRERESHVRMDEGVDDDSSSLMHI